MMQWFVLAGYTAFFCFLISRLTFFHSEQIQSRFFIAAFLLKIATGIYIGKFFMDLYGGGDTWQFFKDGNVLFTSVYESPVQFFKLIFGIDDSSLEKYYSGMLNWNNSYDMMTNDARLIIRINALIRFFSLGYYNVHVVFFCFLSLIGLTALFKTFCFIIPDKKITAFTICLLIPSVFFWSSGILKEGILLFALGIFMYYFFLLVSGKFNFRYFIWALASLILLINIKAYVLLILIPGLAATVWSYQTNLKNTLLKFAVCYGLFYLVAFNIHHLIPKLDLPYLIHQKQFSMRRFSIYMDAKTYFYVSPVAPYSSSIIKHVPEALWNTLARPYPGESTSWFLKMASTENIVLQLTMLFSIFTFNRKTNFNQPLFWLSVFLVINLFALAGLTTCLFGSLIRYKVPALPFLLFIFIYFSDFSKFKTKVSD